MVHRLTIWRDSRHGVCNLSSRRRRPGRFQSSDSFQSYHCGVPFCPVRIACERTEQLTTHRNSCCNVHREASIANDSERQGHPQDISEAAREVDPSKGLPAALNLKVQFQRTPSFSKAAFRHSCIANECKRQGRPQDIVFAARVRHCIANECKRQGRPQDIVFAARGRPPSHWSPTVALVAISQDHN
jgi:hypothetical protein